VCVNDVGAKYGFRPIVDVCEAPDGGDSSLSALLGRWEFVYSLTSTFRDHYHLQRITTSSGGIPFIEGVDLDAGGPVAAARIQDLTSFPAPYTFALLDPDIFLCDFFVFNKTGPDAVQGEYYLVLTDSFGQCDANMLSDAHPFTGSRFASASSESFAGSSLQTEAFKIKEENRSVIQQTDPLSQVDSHTLKEIIQALQEPRGSYRVQ
jgi:hypothetical protein